MKISIIIPTYNRKDLLKQCLDACLSQSLAPFEIIIGDDSTDTETEVFIGEFRETSPIKIIYFHHSPSLGQGKNVDQLIKQVNGSHICLIHDDDLLTPHCLKYLSEPFKEEPSLCVSFGKQFILGEDDQIDEEQSTQLNQAFYRTSDYSGVQKNALFSAILGQFPNNGFLIRADIAKDIGYMEAVTRFGDACDYGFGILIAEKYPDAKFNFTNDFTACYRTSNESIARGKIDNDAALTAFLYVSNLSEEIVNEFEIHQWLRSKVAPAIGNAINLRHTKLAFEWIFSKYHVGQLFTPGGIKRFAWGTLTALRYGLK